MAFHSSPPRFPGALRAAFAVTVPGAIALAFGHESAMILIASGGFIVFYGEGHPYRSRLRVLLTAAALLVAGATAGAFVGSVMWAQLDNGGSHWWLLLSGAFTAAIATAGAYVQNALKLRPPGVFFIVMVAGGSTMVARMGLNPLEVGGWAVVGAISAVVVSMFPGLIAPQGPQSQAVSAAERAVASFGESDPSLGKHHQAQTAVAGAWSALGDAGVISGGKIVRDGQRELVERTMRAHRALVVRNAEVGFSHNNDSDISVLFDENRMAIPHTRPSIMYRLTRSANRHSHAFITAEKVLLATMLAAVTGVALGFDRPDWAVVSALLMLQWARTASRARCGASTGWWDRLRASRCLPCSTTWGYPGTRCFLCLRYASSGRSFSSPETTP